MGQHELTNILVNGGSKVNVMTNNIHQYFQPPKSKIMSYILYMTHDLLIIPLDIFNNV